MSELTTEQKLAIPIRDCAFSRRVEKALGRADRWLPQWPILTVGQLVTLKEEDLLMCRNFGETSLNEVKVKLAGLGLALDMNAQNVPRPKVPSDLRDWFAGQALAGMASNPAYDDIVPNAMAEESYQLADAMLAERAKP